MADDTPATRYARKVLDMRKSMDAQFAAPTAVTPASSQMLDQVRPVSFNYKPGFGGPERHYGVLAQDLEKSPMGASLVSPDAQGVKHVDVAKAAMANMAATADLHQRVKALEGSGKIDDDAAKRMEAHANDMRKSMDAQLATSDEVVKDDIQKEGISPQQAYASRVQELMFDAKQGEPEAPKKLDNLMGASMGPGMGTGVSGAVQAAAQAGQHNWNVEGELARHNKSLLKPPTNYRDAGDTDISQSPNGEHILSRLTGKDGKTTVAGVSQGGLTQDGVDMLPANERAAYARLKTKNDMASRQQSRHGYMGMDGETSREEVPFGPPAPNASYADKVNAQVAAAKTPAAKEAPRPTVAEQILRKYGPELPRHQDEVVKELESDADGRRKAVLDYVNSIGELDNKDEPGGRAADHGISPGGLAGVDPATLASAPPPKVTDAAAEPEGAPPPPAYSTVPDRDASLIGPAEWASLTDAQKANLTAAMSIKTRMGEQTTRDEATADEDLGAANRREIRAGNMQSDLAARREDLDAKANDIMQSSKDLANYHEDPNHFWATRSTPQKIAGFLGVLLGGFAARENGGRNVAMEQLNKAQDADIAAQRHNYMANKESLEAKRSAFGMAMQRYNGDEHAAEAAVRLAHIDRAEAMARKAASQHAGTDTMNRLDEFLAKSADQKADIMIRFHKWEPAHTVRTDGAMGLTQPQQFQLMMKRMEIEAKRQEDHANAEGKSAEKADERADRGAEFIAREVTSAKIPEAKAANKDAAGVLNQDDPAGVGRIKSHLPEFLLSGEGYRNQTILKRQAAAYRLANAGVAVNPKEAEMVDRVTDGRGSLEDKKQFQVLMEHMAQEKEDAIRRGATPEANRRYDERQSGGGGKTPKTFEAK